MRVITAKHLAVARELAAVLYATDKRLGPTMPRALRLRLMRALNRARALRLI